MNILYLAHRIPYPPNKGDKLRSFHQIEHLSRGHTVWCACFVDTRDDTRYIERVGAYCRDVAAVQLRRPRALVRGLAGLMRGGTITESFYTHPAMRDVLEHWCTTVRFDAVVAFSSSMAPYALAVPARRRVLDLCDLDSQKWLEYAAASRAPGRWLYHTEGRRLACRERSWIGVFDATLVITEAEAAPLDHGGMPDRVYIVGNGVTLPDDQPINVTLHGRPARSANADRGAHRSVVGFVGAMDYRPNVDAVCWFVSTCWRRIQRACPGAVFRIVGRSPTRRVRRLKRVAGVEVVGAVDDVMAQVRAFDVSVAPMRIARGLQNKVLEAMAARKPVVLTTAAATGIGARHGEEFLVADRPDDVVRRVVNLLADPLKRERIGQAARAFVATDHAWAESLRTFELIVTGALQRTARQCRRPCGSSQVQQDELVSEAPQVPWTSGR